VHAEQLEALLTGELRCIKVECRCKPKPPLFNVPIATRAVIRESRAAGG
jgi:hypothetical protein